MVSWPTAKHWITRYRELGPEGMGDRSSWLPTVHAVLWTGAESTGSGTSSGSLVK
ncbi:hypothetical protein ACIPY2_20625 [Paenarthrobacter sp. NPDC089675]|uniref:hypothetical protein n=1 Tax=Paenarthrobacter TaxID=1742992 RepID=UPI00381D377D